MKAQKSIRNISLLIPVYLLALLFTSSTLAVEPTTFPTNKPVTQTKPGSTGKTADKTGKVDPSKASSSKKGVKRKGTEEAGVLVEPTLTPKVAPK